MWSLAAKKDGTVLGLKLRLIADIGAYNMLFTAGIPTLTMLMASATYNIPAIRVTVTEVFTNKTPTDSYRGAGRPEATYFVERGMDMLARELKMDPAELRRKNFIKPNQFPFQTQTGAVYDSGDYEKALDRALQVAGWERLKKERDSARAQGRLVGLGLSMYVEVCGVGPSAILPMGGWEHGMAGSAPRPAPRRMVRETKPRLARCWQISSACRSNTLRFTTAIRAS
jgi:carbon-monoxide dehydrogenase large subunit